MVERFKRTKDSFVNKNRNISSKDYISLCYKQITINPSLQTRGSQEKPWLVMNINNLLSEQSTKLTLQRHLVNLKTGKFHLYNNELEDGATQLFTEREKEVFALIAQGLDSTAIAEKLFISEHTVNNHRRHVLSKTHTANTIQALVYAKLLGII